MIRSVSTVAVFCIMCLSGVNNASGQSVEVVKELTSKKTIQNASTLEERTDKESGQNGDSTNQGKKNDSSRGSAAEQATPTFGRWIDLQTATLALRYAYNETSSGIRTFNRLQHSEIFKARFKFDNDGKYSLNAGLSSGP